MTKNSKIIKNYTESLLLKNHLILYADIETILVNETHELVCISIVSGDISESFDNIKDFFAFLKKLDKCRIYFHNFGRFDSFFILKHLDLRELKPSISIIEKNNIIYQIILEKNIIF